MVGIFALLFFHSQITETTTKNVYLNGDDRKIDCFMRLNKKIERKYKCPRAFFSISSASFFVIFINIECNFWIVFIGCFHVCFYR